MKHINDVMAMLQGSRTFNDGPLDDETLALIKAQVKSIAEELIHQQSQEQPVRVLLTKKPPLLSMQRQPDYDDRSR